MSFIWLALTDGDRGSLWAGLPFAAAAGAAWAALAGRAGISLPGLALFSVFFAWQSLLAGIDVAWRVFSPSLPVRPGFADVRLRVPEGTARVFMVDVLNLLPGTLSVEISGDRLRLHVLDESSPLESKVRLIEERAAAVFGIDLNRDN